MAMFASLRHLLPRGSAWSLTIDRTLRKFFQGLAAGALDPAREFIDAAYAELDPETTTHLTEWEQQFGLYGTQDEATRRQRLGARWATRGGQGPDYIEERLQAAGFPVYVHECWTQGGSLNVISNGRFAVGDPPDGWTPFGDASLSSVEDTGPDGTTTTLLRVTIEIGDNAGAANQANALEIGVTYRAVIWARGDGDKGQWRCADGAHVIYTGTISDEWQLWEGEFEAQGATFQCSVVGDAATEDHGDFALVDLRPVWTARDPRDYTEQPTIGTWQCDGDSVESEQAQCTPAEGDDGTPLEQPMCCGLLANNPRYLVNKDLSRRPPPAIPSDEDAWPYFLYIGPETLKTKDETDALVSIPNSRRAEFERLLLQICPTQQWLVVMVDFTTEGVFDTSFDASFE